MPSPPLLLRRADIAVDGYTTEIRWHAGNGYLGHERELLIPAQVLTTKGTSIVDSNGREVLLCGFGLGGWMNRKNFIAGYPANEEAQRQAIRR